MICKCSGALSIFLPSNILMYKWCTFQRVIIRSLSFVGCISDRTVLYSWVVCLHYPRLCPYYSSNHNNSNNIYNAVTWPPFYNTKGLPIRLYQYDALVVRKSLSCWMRPRLEDIYCHVWPYSILSLQITNSRHQITSKMGCQPGDCRWQLEIIFLGDLYECVWINILTFSPARGWIWKLKITQRTRFNELYGILCVINVSSVLQDLLINRHQWADPVVAPSEGKCRKNVDHRLFAWLFKTIHVALTGGDI